MVGICLLSLFNGCQSHEPSVEQLRYPNNLIGAAYQTYVNYKKSVPDVNFGDGRPIPAKYWTDPITALKPLKVYLYGANLVVVQKISGNSEEGKYFVFPEASYVPATATKSDGAITGVGDFTFSSFDSVNGAFNFKRTKGKAQKSQPPPAD